MPLFWNIVLTGIVMPWRTRALLRTTSLHKCNFGFFMKKSPLFKSSLVSGMLEVLPSQPPCSLPSPQCAALHLRVCPSPFIPQSLALNLINRHILNRLTESQKIIWKSSPKALQSFPSCHTITSAYVIPSRHFSNLTLMLHLLMLERNILQPTD